MRQLLVLAAVAGFALGRPETYREKEDFQFSRSSSDEGSKSGYYGAQRGNMGGNYERSHNMDSLAQNQMSGLVKTVEGELAQGANQQTGSVYSAANSRGIYGSGHYDLSNLQGRNFQEGTTFSDSQAHSASHGSSYGTSLSQNAGYSGLSQQQRTGYGASQSQLAGYVATGQSGYGVGQTQNAGYRSGQSNSRLGYSSGQLYSANQDLQTASQHEDRTSQNSGFDSGYYAQAAGYQGQTFGQANSHVIDGANVRTRLISATPVRVVIRPGAQVIVPVAAQTYDASQTAASFDQNAINTDTEVLHGTDQQVALKPQTKSYQSAYSYRKEWEKHNTQPASGVVPLAVPVLPTVNPYPQNSELYEDALTKASEQSQRAGGAASQSHYSSHSGYSANSATSSQSRYNAQQSAGAADQSLHAGYNGAGAYASTHNNAGAYIGVGNGAAAGLTQVDALSNKPKSYQSSYSYHKSWERQGDPYVIEPDSNGLQQTSGKLVSASQASDSSHHYGSHHSSHQSYNADCDVCRYKREASSYNNRQQREDLSQQSQNLKELGQLSQSTWDQIPNLGQEVQSSWDGQNTEDKWDRLEDLGQQAVNKWDQHDLGQQTQNTWGNLETQSQTDLGQQIQETWSTLDMPHGNHEGGYHHGMDMVHQRDNTFDIFQTTSEIQSAPESNKNVTMVGNFGNSDDIKKDAFDILQSPSQTQPAPEPNKDTTHHHTIWDEIKKEEIGQETEDTVEDLTQIANHGQQTQTLWGSMLPEDVNSPWQHEDKDLIHLTPIFPGSLDMPNPHPWMYNQVHHHNSMNQFYSHNSSSYSSSHSHSWQEHSSDVNASGHGTGSHVMNLWNKLDNLEKDTIPSHGKDGTGSYALGTFDIFGTQAQQNQFGSHYNNHGQRESNTIPNNSPTTPEDSLIITNSPETEYKPLLNVNTIKPEQTTTSPSTAKPSTVAINNNVHPLDIGRGDIGPEDAPNEPIESQPSKPNKKVEINTNNVTEEDNYQNKELSVLSLEQQHTEQDKEKSVISSITTSIEKNNQQHMHNGNFYNVHEGRNRDMEQFEGQSQHNYDQETIFHEIEGQHNIHQNTDQQFVDFGQQNLNIGSDQMEQQFGTENHSYKNNQDTQKHESLGHQNVPFVDFGQQNEHVGGEQAEQKFEIENPSHKDTQDTQKLDDLGQQNVPFVDFGQQSESNGGEQKEQKFDTQNFEPIESLHQENKKHSVEELGQSDDQIDKVSLSEWKADRDSAEDLSQQNKQEDQISLSGWKPEQPLALDFGQQKEQVDQISQPLWKINKPAAADDQQNEQFDQVSGWKDDNFNQQEHKLYNWEQQENLEQQSQSGWTEGMEGQLTQAAWMPIEDLQQHSQSFGEHVWVPEDQQVQTAWKPTKDLQQSYVPDTFVEMDHGKPSSQKAQVLEEATVPKKVAAVDSLPEPTTEKPGFWKSVGNKLTSAKDKVASWFSKDKD